MEVTHLSNIARRSYTSHVLALKTRAIEYRAKTVILVCLQLECFTRERNVNRQSASAWTLLHVRYTATRTLRVGTGQQRVGRKWNRVVKCFVYFFLILCLNLWRFLFWNDLKMIYTLEDCVSLRFLGFCIKSWIERWKFVRSPDSSSVYGVTRQCRLHHKTNKSDL